MRQRGVADSWQDDKFMIRQVGRNGYQLFRHIRDDVWVNLPHPTGHWYRSLSAAHAALKQDYNHELKLKEVKA